MASSRTRPASSTARGGEVAYALKHSGEFAGATPLFSLYRSQRVVVPDTKDLNWPTPKVPKTLAPQHAEMAWIPSPAGLFFLNPSDLAGSNAAKPLRSLDLSNPDGYGSTLLLTDVISFQVHVLKSFPDGKLLPEFEDLGPNTGTTAATEFDTYGSLLSTSLTANKYTIRAIQISIRVWDRKTEQARQVTIIQDM